MTDVSVEIEVARPRDEVAAYAADWRNDAEWIGAIDESRLVGDERFAAGSRVLRVGSFLGKRIEYVNEVTDLEPGHRLAMRSVESPFPMTVAYDWEDSGAGTRMRIRAQGDASGFYRLAAPVMSRVVRRSIAADLRRLRAALEGGTR